MMRADYTLLIYDGDVGESLSSFNVSYVGDFVYEMEAISSSTSWKQG